MKYKNIGDFSHDAPESLGILLLNLGTPDAPTTAAVRRYLREFLSDPRVIEVSRPIWWLILHAVILRIRPARSARAYQSVWSDAGSPLLDIAQRQTDSLRSQLDTRIPGAVRVELGMRYGNPSIPTALARLAEANVRRLLVLPLYPQYSATTTASTFDAVTRELSTWRCLPEVRFVNQYHDDDSYIEALASSIRTHWATHGQSEKLLFSFHGIPRDYFLSGDPYYCHCHKTARLVTERLGLDEERWLLSFQSRVGNKEWLKPYTDHQLKAWGAAGVESVQVICPGFSADCLETLEEIAVENRNYFLKAGGKTYGYIPALNDAPAHIDMLTGLIEHHTQGWPEATESAARRPAAALYERQAARARTSGLGA